MDWSDYPLGTKAHAVMGGYWIKVERGWKWCNGDTFPTPGADVLRIELPDKVKENSMRDIKFRAWDKKRKRMYQVLHLHLDSREEVWATVKGFDIIEQKDIHIRIQPKYIELMQYTGLNDKNGKEIYEGDIVKYFGKWKGGNAVPPDFMPHRISWVMGGFHAIPMDIHTAVSSHATNWKGVGHTDCEIIGNIYENPELLGKGG